MKKLLLMLFLLGPVLAPAGNLTTVSNTRGRVVLMPSCMTYDGISSLVTVANAATVYMAVVNSQPAAVFPAAAGVTAVASMITPNDLVGGVGRAKFYAICSLASATNTVQLQGTFIAGAGVGVSLAATSFTGWQGVTTTAGYQLGVNGIVPAIASTSLQAVELVSITSSSTAAIGLNVQPNRPLSIWINRVNGTNSALYIYGIVMTYAFDPKLSR
jgi:hypothetical protein